MQRHADLNQRALVNSHTVACSPSPLAGVERLMLERSGAEVVHAISLVRWAPATRFEPHRYPGGEEILVLDGIFQDEHGEYHAGSWLRNPPGSIHRPWSDPGCTIWSKTGHLLVTLGPDGSGRS